MASPDDNPPDSPEIPPSGAAKKKKGGPRSTLTWQQKLQQVERDVIIQFLKSHAGSCDCNGIKKVLDLGEEGVTLIQNLRDARLAGM